MASRPEDDEAPFVGIDGTRGRWIVVALRPDGTFARALLANSLREALAAHRDATTIAVDVPIGLPERGQRAADLEAKMLLGPRRSTIFYAPPRPVLAAPTYAEARQRARELTGKGISAQSYALRHNVIEAEPLALDERVHEVHPELGFRSLAGRVVASSKRSWNGAMERLELLRGAGIDLPADLAAAGAAPVDDVLDAAICAWVARRIDAGEAECVPHEPERDATGRPMRIWF